MSTYLYRAAVVAPKDLDEPTSKKISDLIEKALVDAGFEMVMSKTEELTA